MIIKKTAYDEIELGAILCKLGEAASLESATYRWNEPSATATSSPVDRRSLMSPLWVPENIQSSVCNNLPWLEFQTDLFLGFWLNLLSIYLSVNPCHGTLRYLCHINH